MFSSESRMKALSKRLCVRNLINKDVSQKSHMKYDERICKFNMDTGCVELLLRDGRMISINCTGVEDALDVTMAQRSELNYLIQAYAIVFTAVRVLYEFWREKVLDVFL